MRQFLKKTVVGAVTLALALSVVDVTQASSQGSNGQGGKPGLSNSVAKGKGGSKGKGKGKSMSKGKKKGKNKGKWKWKNKSYKWKHWRFYDDYGTTLYSDDGDDTFYYWCQPDNCYYPVDYTPYGKYSWDEE